MKKKIVEELRLMEKSFNTEDPFNVKGAGEE